MRELRAWTAIAPSSSGNRRRKQPLILTRAVAAILGAVLLLSAQETDARTVRVGVYDNPPKVGMSLGGRPRGIFIDIIKSIAEREHWDLQYVYGTWDEGLTRIDDGSIDLMPDVAFSDARSERFAFNKLTVLSSWLQVFCRKNTVMGSVADLQGRTVAVLEGSIQQAACNEIREQLGLTFTVITLPDYETTIRYVESGKADATIVSRFYGYRREEEHALVSAPVILRPTTLHFAAQKGRNQVLLDAIDKHLAEMMNDPNSVYYRSLGNWLHEKPRTFIPEFILWTIAAIAVGLLFFLVWSLLLRWQVRRRTEELAEKNQQLQRALEELKLARDEALKRERLHAFGQLASGAAHDFNNLLVPILSYADLMLTDPSELDDVKDIRTKLEVIRTAANHGTEIVHRMQAFCHSAERAETKDRVDTNAAIRDVVDLAKRRWTSRSSLKGAAIEVVLKLDSNADIMGRKTDVHEMLLNLVLNAVDAMPEGGRLELATEKRDGTVRITVKDSGTGMTQEVLEKCLQPFFTTKGAKGTGMGLTMVNTIVAEHDGRMDIVSAVGAGTSFVMTFPCAPERVETTPEQPSR